MFKVDWLVSPHWADAFQGMGTAIGAVISLLGFILVIRQLRTTRQAVEAQTEAQIYQMGLEVYRLLVEHPDLGAYFHDGEPLPPSGNQRHKVMAAFEAFCDYFEYIIVQSYLSKDIRESWIRYMTALIQRSVALQEFVQSRKMQYTPQFLAVFDAALANRSFSRPLVSAGGAVVPR